MHLCITNKCNWEARAATWKVADITDLSRSGRSLKAQTDYRGYCNISMIKGIIRGTREARVQAFSEDSPRDRQWELQIAKRYHLAPDAAFVIDGTSVVRHGLSVETKCRLVPHPRELLSAVAYCKRRGRALGVVWRGTWHRRNSQRNASASGHVTSRTYACSCIHMWVRI